MAVLAFRQEWSALDRDGTHQPPSLLHMVTKCLVGRLAERHSLNFHIPSGLFNEQNRQMKLNWKEWGNNWKLDRLLEMIGASSGSRQALNKH